ncbi:hypothetical protein C0J52_24164 [Blattella germanica]|nr:hypothetical protein C0J52_24164 [Blattella germanica]
MHLISVYNIAYLKAEVAPLRLKVMQPVVHGTFFILISACLKRLKLLRETLCIRHSLLTVVKYSSTFVHPHSTLTRSSLRLKLSRDTAIAGDCLKV